MDVTKFSERADDIASYTSRKGADDVIVNAFSTDSRQIRFSESRQDIFKRWNQTYFHIFLAKERRVVSTTVKGWEDYRRIVDAAIRTAELSQPSDDYMGIASVTSARSRRKGWKPQSDAALGELVTRAVNASAENGAARAAGTLYNTFAEHYLTSSAGISRHENGSSLYLSIRCFADEQASGHSVISSLSETRFRPEKAAEKAAGLAVLARNPVRGDEGRFDSLLDPMVVATLTSEAGSMCSAFNVMSGFSCFEGKLGRRVASEAVSIDDDATRNLSGKRYFDDEGVAVRKTALISRGVLKHYLHNTSTARRMKERSTGNAGLIAPEAFSISMKGGREGWREMLSGMRDGLYINNVWYTRYQNRRAGTFSTIPRDAILRVRRGEITGAVRDIRVTENLINILKHVSAVSMEREHVSWWLESYTPSTVPYALVRKVNITRSAD